MNVLVLMILIIDYLAVAYFFLVNGTYIILNIMAFFTLRRYWFLQDVIYHDRIFESEFYKPLSIIIPAFNEEKTIVENIHSVLALQYPEYEIVVVNDGSTDKTLSLLKEHFRLVPSLRNFETPLESSPIIQVYDSLDHPQLVIIDKENGGKADSLNAGINVSQYPLVCNIDADSLIDSNALLQITEPFVMDKRVVAAGGTIRIANNCVVKGSKVLEVKIPDTAWPLFQVVEYLRAFLFGRVGWARINSLLIISGAFGIFRKKHLITAGGYRRDTVGEDMELVLRMNRVLKKEEREYRVVFLPDPVCWTQVPEDKKNLQRQRRRWQRGLGQSLFMNKELFFNPSYGILGLIAYPFFFFVEFLGPVVEFFGYFMVLLTFVLGIGSEDFFILFFVAAVLMGILTSVLSLLLEEISYRKYKRLRDSMILFLFAIIENFGYRQLVSFWRLQGLIDFLRKREGWGEQKRRTFDKEKEAKVNT